MPSTADLLPLWNLLGHCAAELGHVHRLLPKQRRIDFWSGAQIHHVPTLVLCLRGQARVIYERDKKLDLNHGEAVLIGPGIFHRHEKLRGISATLQQGITPTHSDFHLEYADMHFSGYIPPELTKDIFNRIIHQPYKVDPQQNSSSTTNHNTTYHNTNRHATSQQPLQAKQLAKQQQQWRSLLSAVLSNILNQPIENTRSVPPAVQEMFHYFVRCVHTGISAEDVIQVSALSRSQAYKLWTTFYGSPLREAISQQRLQLAKLLLTATTLPIEAIADRCGFSSRQQMTRLFQQLEQSAPRDWRQLQHENLA